MGLRNRKPLFRQVTAGYQSNPGRNFKGSGAADKQESWHSAGLCRRQQVFRCGYKQVRMLRTGTLRAYQRICSAARINDAGLIGYIAFHRSQAHLGREF